MQAFTIGHALEGGSGRTVSWNRHAVLVATLACLCTWLNSKDVRAQHVLVSVVDSVIICAAPVNPEVEAWVAREYPARALEVMTVNSERLSLTGRSLTTVKLHDSNTGEVLTSVYDEFGRPYADLGRGLREAEADRRFDIQGALDDELVDIVLASDDSTPIPVAIWLRTHETTPDRAQVAADPFLSAAVAAERQAERMIAIDALREFWPATATDQMLVEPDAPVVFTTMRRDEIFEIMDAAPIAQIYFPSRNVPQWATYVDSIQANVYGFDGVDSRVCVIEPDPLTTPNTVTVQATYCAGGVANTHGVHVLGVIRSSSAPYGSATSSLDYFAHWAPCDPNASPSMQWCADQAATVWNFSHTCSTVDTRLFDYYAKQFPYPVVTLPSGNLSTVTAGDCPSTCTNARDLVTCSAYNALVVGGANDCGTSSRADDRIWCTARDSNVNTRELPYLVAPAYRIDTAGDLNQSGTSFAAPQVAGAALQIQEHAPNLKTYPEAVRAILMAGAAEDVDGVRLSLHDGVDDRDGVGLLDIARSHDIANNKVNGGNAVAQHGYDYGYLNSATLPAGSWYSEVYRTGHYVAGGRLRVVLVWDSTATCSNAGLSNASCSSDQLDADLDLYVYRVSDGAMMGRSTSTVDGFEFIQLGTGPGVEYDIKVKVTSWTNSTTFFGLAFTQGAY